MVIFLSDSRLQLLVFFSSFFIDYYTHWRNIVLDRIDVIQWSGESRTRRTIFIEIYWIRNLIRKRNFCCWIWFRIFDVRDVFAILRELCERDFNDEFHWRSLVLAYVSVNQMRWWVFLCSVLSSWKWRCYWFGIQIAFMHRHIHYFTHIR